ncbi:MAG: hypothetical protein FLDDKLPJ_01975 [Phycisphaerae bacterium]|nr:hypothetical protein [Phycisphaerae bacterium]
MTVSLLAQTQPMYWLPPDYSTHGWQIDQLINWMHVFMAVLFVGWGAFFTQCLVKYRYRRNPTALYEPIKAKASKVVEAAVVVIEVVLLVAFAIPVLAEYKNDPPKPEDNPFEVHVVAQQFAWNIHYPGPDGKFGKRNPKLVSDANSNPLGLDRDGDPDAKDDIVGNNEMHLPVGRPIIVKLTSKDVIHSFSVPMLRVKQDTVPGMEIPVWFTVKEGTSSDAIRETMIRTVAVPAAGANPRDFVLWCTNNIAVEDIKGSDGTVIVGKGREPSAEHLEALQKAGIGEIRVAPRHPVEIHCTQLCGITHYKMRGFVILMPPDEFETWYAEQAAGGDEFIEE